MLQSLSPVAPPSAAVAGGAGGGDFDADGRAGGLGVTRQSLTLSTTMDGDGADWRRRGSDPPSCPYVVQFYGAYADADAGGNVNIVMEYCGGGTLQELMDATGGVRDERVLARIAAHVLRGLAFLHGNNQLHRVRACVRVVVCA